LQEHEKSQRTCSHVYQVFEGNILLLKENFFLRMDESVFPAICLDIEKNSLKLEKLTLKLSA